MTLTDPVLIKVAAPRTTGHPLIGYNVVERRAAKMLTRMFKHHEIVEIFPELITEMKQMGMVRK